MDFIGRIEQINAVLNGINAKFVSEVFDESILQSQIIDLNQNQLYDKGVTADGDKLGNYSQFTINYKRTIAGALGNDTRTDHITLKDTGAFYSSMKFEKDDRDYWISGDTMKETTDLLRAYGNILGLTVESWNEIFDDVIIFANKNLRDKIFA